MTDQQLHYEHAWGGTLLRRDGKLSWRCPECRAEGQSKKVLKRCPKCDGTGKPQKRKYRYIVEARVETSEQVEVRASTKREAEKLAIEEIKQSGFFDADIEVTYVDRA